MLGELVAALLLKPALVLGAAFALTRCLSRHSAATRHAVWAGAIGATLVLPITGALLPPLRVAMIRPASPTPDQLVSLEPAAGSGPASRTGFLPPVVRSGNPALDRGGENDLGGGLGQMCLAGWMAGVLFLGLRRLLAGLALRRLVRRARPTHAGHVGAAFEAAVQELGPGRTPALRVSGEITTPAVAGLFHPTVLLPVAVEFWPARDLEPVLVHELGHVARHDCLINLVADLATMVYWVNPLARIAAHRLRSESERACDDRVVERGAAPEGYAHLLLRVAHGTAGHSGLPRSAIAMARSRELESRLLAVLDPSLPRRALARGPLGFLVALGAVLALPAGALSLRAGAVAAQRLPEPDRLGDSLAAPASERLPRTAGFRLSRNVTLALRGADSLLARLLLEAAQRAPEDEADLRPDRSAWALERARDGRVVEVALDSLESPDWRVRAYAAWTLAVAGERSAVQSLVPRLSDPVWRLRAMVAFALRALADPAADSAMEASLTDPAWQVRTEAVEYFIARGGPRLAERIRPRLDDRHVAVRLAASRALTP